MNIKARMESNSHILGGESTPEKNPDIIETESTRDLLQDLQSHHLELEKQNEELRRTQLELLDARDRLSNLYDFAPVGYITLRPDGLILDVNLTFAEMMYVEHSRLIDSSLTELIHASSLDTWCLFLSRLVSKKRHHSCEVNMLIQNGSDALGSVGDTAEFWVRVDGRPIMGGEEIVTHIHLSFNDVSEQRRGQRLLQQQAFYDTLTELPNRQLFLNRFQKHLSHAQRKSNHGALLYLDIDNFKFINDSLGHSMGDKILKHVGRVLTNTIRADDTAARLGGDEFVVLLTDLNEDSDLAATEALSIAKKVHDSLFELLRIDGYEVQVETSIGVALFPVNANSVDEIISCADIAMYRAKENGKNGIEFFQQKMYDQAKSRLDVYQDLRRALPRQEFELVYQAQVDQNRKIIGAECLLRWHHPEKGEIHSDEFMSVLESSSLMMEVGEWVLTQACEKLVRWNSLGLPFCDYKLSVNVSPKQFIKSDFYTLVCNTLKETGADPRRLVLEITENMLLTDTEASIRKMLRLKKIGVTFSIDDFGIGYSSLSYIKRLPLDAFKIDQSFVHGIDQDGDKEMLVDTILAIAKQLNLNVIAEGVEEEGELEMLVEKGCKSFQGFLFAHPLPAERFEEIAKYSLYEHHLKS